MAPGERVIYVDTLILTALLSFVMDYLLLWATASVTKTVRRSGRIALGAALGTTYFVLYYLSERGAIPYYGWLRFWPALVLISAGMLVAAFYPLPWRGFLRLSGYFYLISVSSGGAGVAAWYALGWGVGWALLVSIAAILLIAELGWGVVQRTLWQRLYQIPLEVVLFGERIAVNALLDTGNQLRDPVKGSPVIVLEHRAIAELLPEHLNEVLVEMAAGDLSRVNRLLTSEQWSSRFRVIPFRSLGKENGMLVGFRPDRVQIILDGEPVSLDETVVAIYHKPLDPEGAYQALIHPALLDRTTAERLEGALPGRLPLHEGESSHASTSSKA